MQVGRLGTAIRRRREDLGLTQESLGLLVNYSKERVGQLERGRPKKTPDMSTINAFAKALGVAPLELLREAGADVPQSDRETLDWLISQLDEESVETLTEIAHGILRAQLRRRERVS